MARTPENERYGTFCVADGTRLRHRREAGLTRGENYRVEEGVGAADSQGRATTRPHARNFSARRHTSLAPRLFSVRTGAWEGSLKGCGDICIGFGGGTRATRWEARASLIHHDVRHRGTPTNQFVLPTLDSISSIWPAHLRVWSLKFSRRLLMIPYAFYADRDKSGKLLVLGGNRQRDLGDCWWGRGVYDVLPTHKPELRAARVEDNSVRRLTFDILELRWQIPIQSRPLTKYPAKLRGGLQEEKRCGGIWGNLCRVRVPHSRDEGQQESFQQMPRKGSCHRLPSATLLTRRPRLKSASVAKTVIDTCRRIIKTGDRSIPCGAVTQPPGCRP
ncbi:hypothetical protein Bbelb_017460 [Branchiostoma belcheri]|nr:hypothetical protein Bbelb_017460 [Branchiostoma belcheri]